VKSVISRKSDCIFGRWGTPWLIIQDSDRQAVKSPTVGLDNNLLKSDVVMHKLKVSSIRHLLAEGDIKDEAFPEKFGLFYNPGWDLAAWKRLRKGRSA
jgi:hypothetical protein